MKLRALSALVLLLFQLSANAHEPVVGDVAPPTEISQKVRVATRMMGHYALVTLLPVGNPIRKITLQLQGGDDDWIGVFHLRHPLNYSEINTRNVLVQAVAALIAAAEAEQLLYESQPTTSPALDKIRDQILKFAVNTKLFKDIRNSDLSVSQQFRAFAENVITEARVMANAALITNRYLLEAGSDYLAKHDTITREQLDQIVKQAQAATCRKRLAPEKSVHR